jgi:hypothetical protein
MSNLDAETGLAPVPSLGVVSAIFRNPIVSTSVLEYGLVVLIRISSRLDPRQLPYVIR